MLEKLNLKKNVWTATISFAINIVLVFVGYRLVILQGGIEAVGLWSMLMAWVFLVRLGDVGMANATLRFVATLSLDNDSEKIRTYLDTGILANSVLFLFLSISGFFILDWQLPSILPNKAVAEGRSILPVLFAAFFLNSLSGLILGALQGMHLGYVSYWLSIIGNVIQLLVVIVLVPSIGLAGLAWAQVLQYLIVSILGWLLVVKFLGWKRPLPTAFSWTVLHEMLGLSLRVQLANITNGFFEPTSKILVGWFGGLAAQGLFELAYKTVLLPRNAVAAGVHATIPAMVGLLASDFNKAFMLYTRTLRTVIIAIGIVLLLVTLLAPIASILWLGDLDIQYWIFVGCISVGFFFNTVGAPAYNLGLASGKLRNNIWVSCFMLIWNSLFGALLGNLYGAYGVAFSVGLSLLLGGVAIKWLNEQILHTMQGRER